MIKELFNAIFKLIKFFLVTTFKVIKYFFKTLYRMYNEVSMDYKKQKRMSDFANTSNDEIL